MTAKKKITSIIDPLKLVSALMMSCCLWFLTGINFITFPYYDQVPASSNVPARSQDDPSAPVEEKSSESNNGAFQEEFLHEKNMYKEIVSSEAIPHYSHLSTAKLPTIHFELISPPPDLIISQ